GDASARTKAQAAWADWWAKNKNAVNLAKLDEAPRSLGYTLVVQRSPNGRDGSVKEFAPDGKTVRWEIAGLGYPLDAQVLPESNRVLIAEHGNHVVTERDFTGKIHRSWEAANPVGCQRLPDGGTLITHRNGLTEYNVKNERVFSHERAASDMVGAA